MLRKLNTHGVGFLYVCGIVAGELILGPRLNQRNGPIAAAVVAIHNLVARVDELDPRPATIAAVYHLVAADDGQGCRTHPASFRIRACAVDRVDDRRGETL